MPLRLPYVAELALLFALAFRLAGGQPTAPLTPLTVQLDWKPTAQFAGMLVAKQLGFYAKEGLDVTILATDDEM